MTTTELPTDPKSTLPSEGEQCVNCLHEFRKPWHDADHLVCSEFCETVDVKDRTKWHNFLSVEKDETEGENASWGLYPCSECGGVIDDQFYEERVCGECGDRVRLRKRTELLKKVVEVGSLPDELKTEIAAELKR